jgi:SpoIIAA-like
MIERLKESGDKAFGFKVAGRVTAAEVEAFLPQLEFAIKDRGKRTLGILADLSAMKGAEWKARWDEIKFLSKYSDHIARVAVVGAGKWEDVKAEILAGTVLIQAETRYYPGADILHAWHWVKTGDSGAAPGRTILPQGNLMAGYVPEYSEV